MMSRLVGRAVFVIALGVVGVASPGSFSGGTLSSIVLKPSQFGPGYQLKMRSDSHCVQACVTLDLCGFAFKSEALRTDRLQVNYVKSSKALELSNEVVSYQAGGAAVAIGELSRAVATCPTGPVKSTVRGIGPLTYRIQRLTDAQLLPGAVALRIHVSGTANGHHFNGTTTAVYQAHGDHLSGIYIFLRSDATAAAQAQLALHAAEASAQNLKKAGLRA